MISHLARFALSIAVAVLAARAGSAATETPTPAVGNLLVLVDMDGTPTLLVRVTRLDSAIFGAVRAEHTVIDGSPVRDPAVWVPLHTQYWNNHLAPFGLVVSTDMPFWIEEFELLYDSGHAQEAS